MTPDPYALSRLLRSTGKSAREIVTAYNAAHPLAPLSSPNVESWMRPPGASRKPTRPRWDVLAGLADALNIPRADLYRACAGEGPGWPDILPDHTIVHAGTIGCNTYGRDVMLIMARTDGHTLSDNYLTWEQTEKLAAQLADVIGRREVSP